MRSWGPNNHRLTTATAARIILFALLIAALPCKFAHASNAGFGDLLVSAGGLQNRVSLYDGGSGALKVGNFAWDGGLILNGAQGVSYGPSGQLYVASSNLNQIVRFNGITGTFTDLVVASGSGGLMQPYGINIRNGNLFVASYGTNSIKRYDATTGAFLGDFVTAGSGGLNKPTSISFGPDNNLYVSSSGNDRVLKYDGASGAFIGVFVTAGSGGLDRPIDMTFGPGNNLFVTSSLTNSVLQYDGANGAFINTFVPSGGVSDLQNPWGIGFNNGNLYVASRDTSTVKRFDANTGTFLNNFAQPLAPSAGFITFAPVPEPATLALIAIGAVGFLRSRRRG